MTKDMVMRLLTELARENNIVREPWVRDHAHEAASMFKRLEVKIPAVIIAALHERGLELLRQAPILAVEYSTPASEMQKIETRRTVARDVGRRFVLLPKLRDLLDSLSIPKQLRVLHPSAAERLGYRPALRALCKVNPSTLAQKIPDSEELQKDWVSAVQYWCVTFDRATQPIRHIDWIVSNAPYGFADRAGQIADMIVGGRDINPRWSFARAYEAAEQWHSDLAMKSEEETFLMRYGVPFDYQLDIKPLPNAWRYNDLEFVALRSGKDLFEEGRTMHHCVASYASRVVSGQSRIYSVRRNDKPLATFELGANPIRGLDVVSWRPLQLQGPCNDPVSDYVLRAVQHFMDSYREQWRQRRSMDQLRYLGGVEPEKYPLIEGTFNSSGRARVIDDIAIAQELQSQIAAAMFQGSAFSRFLVPDDPERALTVEHLTDAQLLAAAGRSSVATTNAIIDAIRPLRPEWFNVPTRDTDRIVTGDQTP